MKSTSAEKRGSLLIVLHAHLPFIRYPEHEHHLEEHWLYEAITETYIPLLKGINSLLDEGTDFRITLSLSPTLIEMFNDSLLRERYLAHLDKLIEISEKELFRNRGDRRFEPLAKMYHRRFRETRHLYADTYRRDLASAFGFLLDSGKVEIITSAATHAYLPALMAEPASVRAQIHLAAQYFRSVFGTSAAGIWLPECGYTPGIDEIVKDAGFRYFFLESHSLLSSEPRSRHSIYSPVKTPSGAIVFARDVESSKQVWSSSEGYPGDFDYREFYRDIGFDLDYEYLKPYLPGGVRTFTGIKYYRITGKTENKKPYMVRKAMKKAAMHARHFIESRDRQFALLGDKLKIRPVITATYDAELFGHWWFEGPEWLLFMLREGSSGQRAFRFVTPSESISEHPRMETVTPSLSSWGYRGYSETWIDKSNSWIYRHLHRAARLMTEIAEKHKNAQGLEQRVLNQAARELLLAQASDWPFMMKSGNAAAFAEDKFREHIKNFFMLHGQLTSKGIDRALLSLLEQKNSLFRNLDFRVYGDN